MCKNNSQIESYIDEERRVLYVAITRAKDNLYLLSDKENVSLFLKDIAHCVDGQLPIATTNTTRTRVRSKKERTSERKSSEDSKELLNKKILKAKEKIFHTMDNIARWENEIKWAWTLNRKQMLMEKIKGAYVKLAKQKDNLDRWEKRLKEMK